MKTIIFNFKEYEYNPDEELTLLDILRTNNVLIPAECGGNKTCGKCMVHVNKGIFKVGTDIVSIFLEDVLACDVTPLDNCEIKMYIENMSLENNIFNFKADRHKKIGVAADIGTTTLALYFYNLADKKLITVKNAENEQRSYGADVISRLKYHCSEPDKNTLNIVIINQLNKMIEEFALQSGISLDDIVRIVIAGNTVMEHFVSGVNPSGIAEYPYTPLSLFGIADRAFDLGIKINKNAEAYFAPCISGFIGGDVTIGMMYCNIDKTSKNVLYVDIGTNGEMALKVNGKIICCSAAAGPAFEGANISCGTCVKKGAICEAYAEDHKIKFKTIDNYEASGICGSGLIDIICAALTLGIIDETGRIIDSDRISLTDNIFITQKDVREIQLAKSAVAAGIMTMLDVAGITLDDINEVLIAGGFGSNIKIHSACRIGLIPAQLEGRVKMVGNASGNGASYLLLNEELAERVQYMADKCNYIELSENPFFGGEYVSQMMFEEN